MARTRATDFEEKQRGILDMAASVFAEQGMDKASMSQIAQATGDRFDKKFYLPGKYLNPFN